VKFVTRRRGQDGWAGEDEDPLAGIANLFDVSVAFIVALLQKVTDRSMSGEGTRLGTAYRLANGQVVYVPDGEAPPQGAASPKSEAGPK
jgi:hypothetical protein